MTNLIAAPKRTRRQHFLPWTVTNKIFHALPPKNRQIFVIQPGQWQQTLVNEEAQLHAMWTEKIQALNDKIFQNPDPCSDKCHDDQREWGKFTRQFYQDMSRIRHELALTKIAAIVDHVQSLFDHGCVNLAVMVHQEEVVAALKKVFSTVAIFTDEMNASQREVESARFRNDAHCRLFIRRISPLGVSRDFTMATHLLFAEQEWKGGAMNYVEECCLGDRPPESLAIQILVFANSLDEGKCRTLDHGTTNYIQIPQ